MTAAYLDASALVKLMRPEPETDALLELLRQWPVRVASEVVVVELACTARRLGGGPSVDRGAAIAEGLELLPLSAAVRERAFVTAFTPPLRALDAIHLATVLELREEVEVLIAYDRDLCEAALAHGLPVERPA